MQYEKKSYTKKWGGKGKTTVNPEPWFLNLEETKAKIASLEYIQNELNGIPNLV